MFTYYDLKNQYHKLQCYLVTVINTFVLTNIREMRNRRLAVEIEEYLSLHLELFPNCLKPKHHFLIHYGRIMEAIEPLWNISSMIFEHKHQEGKIAVRSAISRVNVYYTIASIKTSIKVKL